MQEDLMGKGFELMLFGMGTVALFLALLVVATTLMSWCVGRYFPEPEPVPVGGVRPDSTAAAAPQDPQLIAVISAAIRQHRAGKR